MYWKETIIIILEKQNKYKHGILWYFILLSECFFSKRKQNIFQRLSHSNYFLNNQKDMEFSNDFQITLFCNLGRLWKTGCRIRGSWSKQVLQKIIILLWLILLGCWFFFYNCPTVMHDRYPNDQMYRLHSDNPNYCQEKHQELLKYLSQNNLVDGNGDFGCPLKWKQFLRTKQVHFQA